MNNLKPRIYSTAVALERRSHLDRTPCSVEGAPLVGRAIAAFPPGNPSDGRCASLMGEVLGALPAGHSIVFSYTFGQADVLRAGVELFAAEAAAGSPGLSEGAFEQVLALALPGARFEPMVARACFNHVLDIRPQALDLGTPLRIVRLSAVPDTDVDAPLAARLADRAFNLSAALEVLACAAPAELRLSIRSFKVDARLRQFGLSLVLANQFLGQVDGIGHKPGRGAAALANAANLIAFRVGAPDAARLGPWFAPDLPWTELCRLWDFHAAVRVLDDGRPALAHVIRMERPPFQDGRSGGIDE